MNIFICTKPLQIMVSMIVSESREFSVLYIVDQFNFAKEISSSARLKEYFAEVEFFQDRASAIKKAAKEKPENVFIDSDMGLGIYAMLCFFKLLSPRSELHLYEEGIGTYRTDIIPSKVKRILYRSIGAGCHFGESWLIKKIHVFDVSKHSAKMPQLRGKTVLIKKGLHDFLLGNEVGIAEIFCRGFKFVKESGSQECYIYLSDWEIDMSELEKTKKHSISFVKPHPNIKESDLDKYRILVPEATWIPGSAPAEIVLLMLCRSYERVFVRHKNSSAVNYMRGLSNLIEA